MDAPVRLPEPAPPRIDELVSARPDLTLGLLRLDQLGGWASGNKYYKLKHYLARALAGGADRIVSKGGMFSNHLAALAAACHACGLSLTCLIRAYQPDERNPTLQRLRSLQATCVFLSPAAYRAYDEAASQRDFPGAVFVPEGGFGPEGWRGTAEILQAVLPWRPTCLVVPVGTMGTALGILSAAPRDLAVVLVPAWRGCSPAFVEDRLPMAGVRPNAAWTLWPDAHEGGIGRYSAEQLQFMHEFTAATGIVLDPVYTGKMMMALMAHIRAGQFQAGDRILALHTGGLQGLAGYAYRFPAEWSGYANLVRT